MPALFASDGVFRPGAAGESFAGSEAIADALFGFLDAHRSGQFETVHEMFAGDEAFHEWKWAGVTSEGEPAGTQGCATGTVGRLPGATAPRYLPSRSQ
jgi:hypothetical protein